MKHHASLLNADLEAKTLYLHSYFRSVHFAKTSFAARGEIIILIGEMLGIAQGAGIATRVTPD